MDDVAKQLLGIVTDNLVSRLSSIPSDAPMRPNNLDDLIANYVLAKSRNPDSLAAHMTSEEKLHWDKLKAKLDKLELGTPASRTVIDELELITRKSLERISISAAKEAQELMVLNDVPKRERFVQETYAWIKTKQFQLGKPTASRAHKLFTFLELLNGPITYTDGGHSEKHPHSFLVMHDWASAFAGDREFDQKQNNFRTPAPRCCFEFFISGRTVIAIIDESIDEDKRPMYFSMPGLNLWDEFRSCTNPELVSLRELVLKNVRAACIALEAEVAEAELVRIPEKQNAARLRSNKARLPDYRVINLANRKRYTPVPSELRDDDSKRQGPRLHFRRGHLRHYPNYNVWIKWQLVGNPDLGFIDHDYKL